MSTHVVERLWLRREAGGPVEPVDDLTLVTGQGIEGDHTFGRMRHVTIVFHDEWQAALADLGRDVDPSGRRANVFVSGGDGLALVGRTVQLGEATLEIKGETRPCPTMERAAEGLQGALEPEGRGGVWGRVVSGGVVRPGDVLRPEV